MKMQLDIHRVNAFSDGVFAIIITIMVLDLKRPAVPTFHALWELWPVWLAYTVSYLFLAIVWVNHHFLTAFASHATTRLIWANFGHLFSVALIPFLTAWIAESRLAPCPVAMYGFIFFLVNLTYLILIYETLCAGTEDRIWTRTQRLVLFRSLTTLVLFLVATVLAVWFPYAGFAIICGCLLLYLRPGVDHLQTFNT